MSISPDKLSVDFSYQRVPSSKKVTKIVKEFSDYAFGVIEVSQRVNGNYVVVDGWHRVCAAKLHGLTRIPCNVHEGMTHAEEAAMFVDLNSNRKPMSAVQKHIGDLQAGRYLAKYVQAVCDLNYVIISKDSKRPKTVKSIWRLYDLAQTSTDLLETTIFILSRLCLNVHITDRMLGGVSYLLKNVDAPKDQIISRLLKSNIEELDASAYKYQVRENRQSNAAWGYGMLEVINKRKRTKLAFKTVRDTK